ncbi:hypothetical protein LWI29_019890 [Acer saccharum]|uniref:Uncharacterized protein n=1 Tax=Acer saccharum TaxID=4024 RepID=A0AA39T2W8_ACESA|nr:hypothetical protein LWI29_019890 [Acer saccharum]
MELLVLTVMITQTAAKRLVMLLGGGAVNTPAATAAVTPSRKGKEKAGASRGVGSADRRRAESGPSPARPKVVASTPAAASTPAVSTAATVPATTALNRKGKEKEPDVAEVPPAQAERSTGAENVAAPPSEGVNEQTPPAAPSQPASPRPASPAVVVDEPGVSDQPRPSGPSESTIRPGPSHQAGTSASGSGSAREVPPTGPVGAEEGSVSLFDFSATEICSHLANNDVYVGEGWGHVKNKSCNKKMEFFFNCHSLMMSEMGDSYKFGIKASREIKRLREQASVLAAEKLSAEESHAQQFAQLRESSDGHLSARLSAEEKLSAAEEEIRSLKELLSSSQESFAARLEAERVAEEAKEKAELEAADLRNQLSSRDLIFENLKAVLELHAVSHFTTVPPIDLPLFLLQSRSTAFPLREQKPQSIDEDDEDPLLAPDKFYHFVFCFSLIHLFSTLASFSCYPSLRSHSISVRSIMSLLAGAAKEFAELEQIFTSPFIGAMDGHIDAVSCMAKNPDYLKGLFSGSMVGDICF